MATDPHDSHEPASADLVTQAPGFTDPAQESLVRALRGSFNILRVLMVVLVILYLLSGLFRVNRGEQGLVARLGKLRTTPSELGETPVFQQGWYWALPDPFDRKYVVTGQIQGLVIPTFLFSHKDAATARDLSEIIRSKQELAPGEDGAMLTGDRNLSHGRWEVRYLIDDAALFVQNVGDSPADLEPLLRRLTETAVVREVAGRTVEEVTREALDQVREGVRRRLQQALERLETGVTALEVNAVTIEPGAVRRAFLDVTRAENEKKRLEHEAEEKATRILNRAAGKHHKELLRLIRAYGAAQLRGADEAEQEQLRAAIDARLEEAERAGGGQVAVKLREARTEANRINERLQQEFKEFTDYLKQREVQPRYTLLDLWVQMRAEILSNKQNEIFFVPDCDEIEILINRDPQRQIEAEEERARKRLYGEPGEPR